LVLGQIGIAKIEPCEYLSDNKIKNIMSSDLRKQKQAYLYKEIIEKGYNAEDFSSYLQKLKRIFYEHSS